MLKEEILKKALFLFLTNSYRDVTINEIQNAVGCSRGCLYHHFKSKEKIFESVVTDYVLPAFSNFSLNSENDQIALLEAVDISIKSRRQYIKFLRSILGENVRDIDFLKFVFQSSEYYPGFSYLVNELINKEIEKWKKVVALSISLGKIKPDIDIDFVAKYFVMLPFGIGLYKAFNEGLNENDIRSYYLNFYNMIKKEA